MTSPSRSASNTGYKSAIRQKLGMQWLPGLVTMAAVASTWIS